MKELYEELMGVTKMRREVQDKHGHSLIAKGRKDFFEEVREGFTKGFASRSSKAITSHSFENGTSCRTMASPGKLENFFTSSKQPPGIFVVLS